MRKLRRNKDHRRLMLRNMAISLILNERIVTTDTRAKELKRMVDKIIDRATQNSDLATRRWVVEIIPSKQAVKKLFDEIVPKYRDNARGGYTKIVKVGFRKGDGAPTSLIELV